MLLAEARRAVASAARELSRTGLAPGTSGNVSARDDDSGLIAITPSAVPYEELDVADVAVVDAHGLLVEGRFAPSSETPMHTEVYARMPWVRGVTHTHSVYATTFACLNRPIEAVHYLIARVGERVPVAPYATYGTPEIGRRAVESFDGNLAVLLQQHGVLTVGRSLDEAMTVAATVEYVARVYHHALAIGRPVPLPRDELRRLRAKLDGYKPTPVLDGETPPGRGS